MCSKTLMIFDFDNTLTVENTDMIAFNMIPNNVDRSNLWLEKRHIEWTEFMNKVFKKLSMSKVSIEQIEAAMKAIPFIEGMLRVLSYCKEHPALFDCIIISDSNSWFIDIILKHNNIDNISKVYTNPADISEDELLHISPCHSHNHTSCPKNMCKRVLLKDYLEECNLKEIYYKTLCYVGDGSNDYCPCTFLKSSDYIFARTEFNLEKKLCSNQGDIEAKVISWRNGYQILTTLEEIKNEDLCDS